MKKIIQTFHLTSLVLTFLLKLRFSADASTADVIKKLYGTSTLTTYRMWERKKRKYEKAVLDVEFLKSMSVCTPFNIFKLILEFILLPIFLAIAFFIIDL